MKTLAEIDSRRKPTTSHHAPTSVAPATTMTTRFTSNSMPNSDSATTPHLNNSEVELPPARKLHTYLYINYILIYVMLMHRAHSPDN